MKSVSVTKYIKLAESRTVRRREKFFEVADRKFEVFSSVRGCASPAVSLRDKLKQRICASGGRIIPTMTTSPVTPTAFLTSTQEPTTRSNPLER